MVDLVAILSERFPDHPWFWFAVRYSPVFGAFLLWCLFASRLDWAPANIPFERRLQTAFVFLGLFAQLFAVQLTALLLVAPLIFGDTTLTRTLCGLTTVYCGYIFFDKTPSRGGYRVSKTARSAFFWRLFTDYFPIKIRREGPEWDPSKKYLLGYHPHGIIGVGCISAFACDVSFGQSER